MLQIRQWVCGISWVIVGILGPAQQPSSLDALQGTWSVQQWVFDGRVVVAAPAPAGFGADFTGDVLTFDIVVSGRPVPIRMSITLDPEGLPGHLDAKLLSGKWAGQYLHGLYKIEEDRLIICLPASPIDAIPQKFESKRGTNFHLWELQRVPSKE